MLLVIAMLAGLGLIVLVIAACLMQPAGVIHAVASGSLFDAGRFRLVIFSLASNRQSRKYLRRPIAPAKSRSGGSRLASYPKIFPASLYYCYDMTRYGKRKFFAAVARKPWPTGQNRHKTLEAIYRVLMMESCIKAAAFAALRRALHVF